jgi:pimeloyl-ACP methyl ester carboxylesterase
LRGLHGDGGAVGRCCIWAGSEAAANTNPHPASSENAEVPFYVKWPSSYVHGQSKGPCRVLFICPCYNQDALTVCARQTPLLDLAEKRGWFVVIPTFKNTGNVRDRKTCYYYPEKFSGKAVCEALDLIKRKYPIATDGLLMQGYSGGAQFVHRFAIWAPERVATVAVNSSTWLDAPNGGSSQVAWLLTIGESDPGYDPSLTFVDQLRKAGALPIFRSYIGLEHGGADGGGVRQITCAFLSFYDDLTKAKLGKQRPLFGVKPQPPMAVTAMPFVGDTQDWKYQKNSPEALDDIAEDSRVYLPSEEVAKVWNQEF